MDLHLFAHCVLIVLRQRKSRRKIGNEMNNEQNIAYWAERTIKAEAWFNTKSLRSKRGGNPFTYADAAVVRVYLPELTIEEFVAQRNAYIAANPMTYSPTTSRLTYLAA
jgi:hypothetical protein